MLLHLSNFCLCLSSVADFSNTGARALTSAECPCILPTWRAMWFGYMVWARVMVIFWWSYFNLINRYHPKRWVAVVPWLNYLTPAVDLCGVRLPSNWWSVLLNLRWVHPLTSCQPRCFPWPQRFNLWTKKRFFFLSLFYILFLLLSFLPIYSLIFDLV